MALTVETKTLIYCRHALEDLAISLRSDSQLKSLTFIHLRFVLNVGDFGSSFAVKR